LIDLHSHILPGIDDGARDIEESVALARIYTAAGYEVVVATPHYIPGTSWAPAAAAVRDGVAALNEVLISRGVDLKVLPGMEIAMDPSLSHLLAQDRLLTLGGSDYLLVEVPFQQLPYGWDQVVFDLISNGYRVLLAHPERCARLVEKPAIFERLIDAGCSIQVNWSSLLGHHGSREGRLARNLAAKGYIHCMATDSHDVKHRNPGFVPQALAVLHKIVGQEAVDVVMRQNPSRVLQSEPLLRVEQQVSVKKARGWRRLFSWG
jgi:protein-tyrosine phosphatase